VHCRGSDERPTLALPCLSQGMRTHCLQCRHIKQSLTEHSSQPRHPCAVNKGSTHRVLIVTSRENVGQPTFLLARSGRGSGTLQRHLVLIERRVYDVSPARTHLVRRHRETSKNRIRETSFEDENKHPEPCPFRRCRPSHITIILDLLHTKWDIFSLLVSSNSGPNAAVDSNRASNVDAGLMAIEPKSEEDGRE
jgi:hypothetical protein